MTGMQLVLLTVIMLAAVGVAFWTGLAMRRRSDSDLIAELEAELDARIRADALSHERRALPRYGELLASWPEIAHEPFQVVQLDQVLRTRPAPQLALAQAADTVWDLPAVLDGTEDMDGWTAALIASTDRFLVQLGIEPGAGR